MGSKLKSQPVWKKLKWITDWLEEKKLVSPEKCNYADEKDAVARRMPVVLCIAGLDPTGGAGLLADVAALARLGVRATGVVTALTVQRPNQPVDYQALDPNEVDRTLATLLEDVPVDAVKIGMLGGGEVARVVARHLSSLAKTVPIVLDPVMQAGFGGPLADPETIKMLWKEFIPLATVVTPNIPEAQALTGMSINDEESMVTAAQRVQAHGANSTLLTGGHLPADPVDVLVGPEGVFRWTAEREATGEVHGTGCALSSLLAGGLAMGFGVREAAERAIGLVRRAIGRSWQPRDGGWRFLGLLG